MRQKFRTTFSQLLWSLAVVAAACVATRILYYLDTPLRKNGNFAFFLAAIAIAAWRGGFLAAMFTVLWSSLIVAWVLPPANSFKIDNQEGIVRFALFVGLGLLISYLHYARQRAEEFQRQADGRLRFALDSSGVACWDVDVKNGTFWKSHNLAEIFGRSDSDFATTYEGFFAYIHPEDREFFHLASVAGGADHRDYQISHRIICGDGTTRKVNTRGRMYIGEDGRVQRMVGSVYATDNTWDSSSQPLAAPASDREIAENLV